MHVHVAFVAPSILSIVVHGIAQLNYLHASGQCAHGASLPSARQPMSRLQKPSGQLMASTACKSTALLRHLSAQVQVGESFCKK